MKVIIACAGTARHINPAIAIANEISKYNDKNNIMFIGSHRKLESQLIPKAGYVLKQIDAYGFPNKISIEQIKRAIATFKGYFESKKIIKEFKPDIVIGTGGYICRPVLMAAHKLKIPTFLHESNAYPGKAIKWLEKSTNEIFLSFDEAKKYLKTNKTLTVGTPVKIQKVQYSKTKKEEILNSFSLSPDKKTILIFGGSQGAAKINENILKLFEKYELDYNFLWATGTNNFEQIELELKKVVATKRENIKIVPYIYNMEEAMNIANIVISRSGAMTIAELSKLNKPAILIPLPNVSNNHQYYNAKVLEDLGAAKIIEQKYLNEDVLEKELVNILKDEQIENKMANATKHLDIKDANELIYNELVKYVD